MCLTLGRANVCTEQMNESLVQQLICGLQAEAAKVAKVREVAIAKLKTLEKQKAEVEKTRDDIKYALDTLYLTLCLCFQACSVQD